MIKPMPTPHGKRPQRQRGVVAIEYALILLLGVLPLLLVCFTGFMIFLAKQSLSAAASDGARAALRYGTTAERQSNACGAAAGQMGWLLEFANTNEAAICGGSGAASGISIVVSTLPDCAGGTGVVCMQVTTSYNYDTHPFLPGTTALLHWTLGEAITSAATIQIDPSTITPASSSSSGASG